ncbi:MAG: hypothetical protein AAGM67_03015, partial [Bacteroidota bacterium]
MKAIEKALSSVVKPLRKEIEESVKLGFSNQSNMTEFANRYEKTQKNSLKKVAALEMKLAEETSEEKKKQISAEIKAEKKKQTANDKLLKQQTKKYQQNIEIRKAAREELRRFEEQALSAKIGAVISSPQRITDTLQTAASDPQRAVEGGLKSVGQAATGVGTKMAAESTNQLVRGLGDVIATVGPLVAGFGAIAGGLLGLLKALVDVDAQAKELNQTILDGASVNDLFVGRSTDLKKALQEVRAAAVDFTNNMKFGTDAKEQIEILNAFNQAGFTFRAMADQLGRGASNMRAYQKATAEALKISKLLGISASEVATNMADMMQDLGTDLRGISKRFSAVYEAAQLSGFSAKRFYSTVLEATSGMALYNIRMEEAAGLLIKLGKVLGTKVAPTFLRSITDMFKSDDMQTRLRKVMLAGQKNVAGIFKRSASNIANDFINKFGDIGKQLSQMGIEGFDKIKGADQLVRHLQKLKPDEQRKLIAKVGVHNASMARQMENLVQVSKGSAGGLSNMATQLDSLDLGGKMQFALTQASALFKKPISELTGVQLAAFQQASGMSMEQIKQLQRVDARFKGNFSVLQEQKNQLQRLYDASQKGDPAAQKKLGELLAQQQKQAKTFGAVVEVTKNGQARIVSATVNSKNEMVKSSKELKSQQDLVQSSGKAFQKIAEQSASEQVQLARQVAQNTTDFNKVLRTGVQYYLEQIYKLISPISTWFTSGGLSDQEKRRKQEGVRQLEDALKKTISQQQTVDNQVSALETKRASAKGEVRERINKDINKLLQTCGSSRSLHF